ncbi:MAG: phosphoglycerate dehydrogenase [Alphaproteobacteria bacterium]|nr:phosphoglycerate dehydrogenase [Alphaproteobacteria bacterium]MCB9928904.1 phosphoglycerate dehydrogenase [Alphaproteobacteria bacterium]
MPKVLISDDLSPRATEIFRERGIEVDRKVGLKPDELAAIIGDYDGLAIRSATKVTADLLAKATNLKVVGRAGIGVDNVDQAAATARGIVVMNTPYGNTITTAEHAIAMMFALARQIPAADRSTQAGKWEKSKFMGVELYAKTLGVVGCGNIGTIVAERALGLRMRVIAFDPFLSPERAADLGVEKVEFEELLRRADFITLHTPMTEQTRGLLNTETLSRCKPGVRIINCARGGLVVEEDLAAALKDGHVAGAAFDVFVQEPARENVLFGLDNVVTTPHLGASTEEAQENVALQVAEQISDYLLTGAVSNALNMPSISAEEAPRLKPFMGLAEQLGSFAGQLTESGLRKLTIEYRGHVAELNTRPLSALVLMGLLRPLLDSVNMVNAPVIARERNIDVTEVKNDQSGDFQSLIRVTVETERQTRAVAGALFGTMPRVVEVQDINFDAQLGSHMLFIRNEDKPGFIGKLGTILGNANVNIANFHLGRSPANGHALALVEIDEPCSDAVAAEIAGVDGVIQAKVLRF